MNFPKVKGLIIPISEMDIMPRAVHNYFIQKNGTHSSTDTNWISSDKIPVSAGSKVKFGLIGHTAVGSVVAYNSNGAVVGSISASNNGNTALFEGVYTIPEGAIHITITGGTKTYTAVATTQYAIITNGSFEVKRIADEQGAVLWERDYRYIRFIINALRDNSTAVTQLSELEFIDEDGNVYSYPSGTMVSSSYTGYSSSETPANIIDGSVNTKFCTPNWRAGGYLQIDLCATGRIDPNKYSRFRWYTANDRTERDPVSFEIRFSRDGINFDRGVSVTNANITTTRKALAYTGACTD